MKAICIMYTASLVGLFILGISNPVILCTPVGLLSLLIGEALLTALFSALVVVHLYEKENKPRRYNH